MVEQLPDGRVRVTLEAAVPNAEGEPKRSIHLRPPTCGEVLDIGEPSTIVVTGTRLGSEYEDQEVIRAYLARLIEDHELEILRKRGTVADALALKDAVKRFFESARKKSSGSAAPSSSTTA